MNPFVDAVLTENLTFDQPLFGEQLLQRKSKLHGRASAPMPIQSPTSPVAGPPHRADPPKHVDPASHLNPALITVSTVEYHDTTYQVIHPPLLQSDGVVKSPPSASYVYETAPYELLIKMARGWQEHENLPLANAMYDRLPLNYHAYLRARPDGIRKDRFIYGHPSGRPYDGISSFVKHFVYLMNGRTQTCKCPLCG